MDDKQKEQKYIEEVERDRDYNLETLDSSLLKYSAAGTGLFVCLHDKFCGSSLNIYFATGLGLFLISMICQLFSYKTAADSQDYCLLFWEEYDKQDKLRAFERYRKLRYINILLQYVTLYSFSFACIAFFVMVLNGTK
jgi:hypothetical protein